MVSNVELFFNFAWLSISLLLVGWKLWSARRSGNRMEWQVVLALGVLLMLLLPVISITDDLAQNNVAAADVEHMLRRTLDPVHPSSLSVIFELVAAAALILDELQQHRLIGAVLRWETSLVRLLRGIVRASSVRPPPAMAIAL